MWKQCKINHCWVLFYFQCGWGRSLVLAMVFVCTQEKRFLSQALDWLESAQTADEKWRSQTHYCKRNILRSDSLCHSVILDVNLRLWVNQTWKSSHLSPNISDEWCHMIVHKYLQTGQVQHGKINSTQSKTNLLILIDGTIYHFDNIDIL